MFFTDLLEDVRTALVEGPPPHKLRDRKKAGMPSLKYRDHKRKVAAKRASDPKNAWEYDPWHDPVPDYVNTKKSKR